MRAGAYVVLLGNIVPSTLGVTQDQQLRVTSLHPQLPTPTTALPIAMGSSSMEEPSDVDVDDELLGLAFDDDDAAPQRKRSASSSLKARTAKRRKQE